MKIPVSMLAVAVFLMPAAHGQEKRVVTPGPHGGGAVYLDEQHKEQNESWGYAGAYRAGDYVYLSGVVTGAPDSAPIDVEAFKTNLHRSFEHSDEILKAAGASIEDVVDITSFHIWDSPLFQGDKLEHMRAVADVKREFMPAPHPAWTAIGVSELIPDRGLIEIRMIAYAPQDG